MAELAGKTNQVYILAGTSAMSGATGAKINGVDSATLNRLADILEISQFGDDYKKRMAGLKDSNISISGNFDPADTNGQNVIVAGDFVYVGLYQQGTAVAGVQVPMIIESVEQAAEVSGQQTFSASFQGNGAPVALPART